MNHMLDCAGNNKRGIQLCTDKGLNWYNFFGMACNGAAPECRGIFYLDSDAGRYEGDKWKSTVSEEGRDSLRLLLTGGCFEVWITLDAEPESGVISWKTSLKNTDGMPHVIYACLPRVPLQGGEYQFYGQYSGWCAEDQGEWMPLKAGNLVLTNSAGRSTESSVPFACIQHMGTGRSAAIHVLPVGDWVIRARRVAGSRSSMTVLEAGLSDMSLRMQMEAGEEIELPELLMYGFEGDVEDSAEVLHRYLLARYEPGTLPDAVYNTWFFNFDVLESQSLLEQAEAARDMGCKIFVVDAGWFGEGEDWANQVGNWKECTERAFAGELRAFADKIRGLGMKFGIWMEPERISRKIPLYTEHPDWFLDSDAAFGVYDLGNPEVREYLLGEVTRVIRNYGVQWMKVDYNTDMARDLTGSNFYRYYVGEKKLYEEMKRRNPSCSFEGCASGGMRTDIQNVLGSCFHGHFMSDTVHPLEVLRMRQNIALRMLPQYMGSWVVTQETPLNIGSYEDRDRMDRTKYLSAGDAWWEYTVDYSLDFILAISLMGEYGMSGDVTSLRPASRKRVLEAVSIHERYREFLRASVCHLLTKARPLNDITGWVAMEYENILGKGSLVFVFRLVDDAETFFVYPRGLLAETQYRVCISGERHGTFSGAELMRDGVPVNCPGRYEARIMELLPC